MPGNSPKNVAVWTEFELPLTDEMKYEDEEWRRIFKPLIEAPGHRGSKWGRIRERPSWVKLVTRKAPSLLCFALVAGKRSTVKHTKWKSSPQGIRKLG
jgi:hypothetical protein